MQHSLYSHCMVTFSDLFNGLCTEKGTTPYQVALEVGISQSTVSLISTGKRKPRLEHLEQLSRSKQLDTSYEKLVAMKLKSEYPESGIVEAYKQIRSEEND